MITRETNMHLKAVIFALSLSATLAYPLHSDTRETTWELSKGNQAHEKTDHTKDVHKIYKSIIDSNGLYTQDDNSKYPVAEEMQRKLAMESERLRVRLRQELAELRDRLSPSPDHLSAIVASIRERLTPLTEQLQSSLSSRTQDLCSHLNFYLQGVETAEAQADPSPALYQEASHWITQSLEHRSLQLTNIINDFHSIAGREIEQLKETIAHEGEAPESKVWQDVSSLLRQEVSSLQEQAQQRVGLLKAHLTAQLESDQPRMAQATGHVEQFCQNAASQSQLLRAQVDRLFMSVEEKVHGATGLFLPSSLSMQQEGSLREDFSVKLSALIQDILHSVQ
ncbi:unnamed protein product [Menidia menidia]|uniref:(Atlantic silverside) hypothetical protein n=1 Tax=Menidia menidia TaxID=238744 RepID=A0A8S4BN69_9TELE|nr:unnamed protein product [Menidia menidia]